MTHPTNVKDSRAPGRGNEPESGRREVRVKRGSWIVALPAFIRTRLGLTEPGPVYWHRGRPGEVVLTTRPTRTGGAPDTKGLVRELADAQRLIARLRQRDESKLRAMYAEGYAHGYQTGVEVTMKPHQRRAQEVRRRKLWAHAFAGAATTQQPKVGEVTRRKVEPAPAPVLHAPAEQEASAEVSSVPERS